MNVINFIVDEAHKRILVTSISECVVVTCLTFMCSMDLALSSASVWQNKTGSLSRRVPQSVRKSSVVSNATELQV